MNKQNETPAQRIYRENVRLMGRLLSHLNCGTALWDTDEGRLVYANQQALDLCGVNDNAALEQRFARAQAENGLTAFPGAVLSRYRAEGKQYVQAEFYPGEAKADDAGAGAVKESVLSVEEDEQEELLGAISAVYAALYLIDRTSGALKTVKQPAGSPVFPTYAEFMRAFLTENCVPEELAEAEKQLSLPAVLTSVSYEGRLETTLRGPESYLALRVLPAGEKRLLLEVRDAGEQVRRELMQKEQLERALSEAQAANRAKSAFLSNMSHDIRTPLNAILGFTDLAIQSSGKQPEKTAAYLEKISASGSHLLDLINDILDMSRIESGKFHITDEEADLSAVIDELADMVRPQTAAKGQRFVLQKEGMEHTRVYCDALRLKQLLLNLLSNAVKFTPAGGTVRLTADERGFSMPGSAAFLFTVEDTGIGMSPEFRAKIFQPFERERTSTISGIQGTGLGMSICKSIVDMMGGSLNVESEVGKGTRFTVALSFRLQKAETGPERHQEKLTDLNGSRILLVEDNELNREIATELLEDRGCLITACENGLLAVNCLRENGAGAFDAVLMDVQMPVMDGYAATRAIRLLPGCAINELPIIAMTANAFAEDRKKAYEAGMNAHIAKPINIDVVCRTLSNLMEDHI